MCSPFLLLTLLSMFIHQSEQHKNLVIITDMEPDDHIAIALVLANGQLRERLRFIGTTLFNAKQKADAVKSLLAGTSLSDIPVFVGTSQPKEGYPHLRSLEPAKQFALKEMDKNALLMEETSPNELQIQLKKALQTVSDDGKLLEIVLLTACTDLMAVLSGHPQLSAGIGQVHAMGGWIQKEIAIDPHHAHQHSSPHKETALLRTTTYNWSIDPQASAMLTASASAGNFPLRLYSSHIITAAVGNSVNESVFNGCYGRLIKKIMESKVPPLVAFHNASRKWDNFIIEYLPQVKEKIGSHAGRQFTPADPVVIVGMLNGSMVKGKEANLAISIDPKEADYESGYRVHLTHNHLESKIELITGIDRDIFTAEMVKSIEGLEQTSRAKEAQKDGKGQKETHKRGAEFVDGKQGLGDEAGGSSHHRLSKKGKM